MHQKTSETIVDSMQRQRRQRIPTRSYNRRQRYSRSIRVECETQPHFFHRMSEPLIDPHFRRLLILEIDLPAEQALRSVAERRREDR